MNFGSIQEAMKQGKGKVALHGWCYRERGSNKLRFITLRDSSNIIQCVVEKEKVSEKIWKDAESTRIETALELHGEIKKDERAPTGYEVAVTDLKIIGKCENFPIQKDQSVEFLADNRHLWLRSRRMTAILKIRSTIFGAVHQYFRSHGFYEYQSPIFQPTQAEGGSEVFKVPYFGDFVFLAQTWQLQAEPAIFSLEKIYTLAPSFRAEKSKTSRHLTEYWHAEMEMAWSKFEDIQDHAEGVIKACVKAFYMKEDPENSKVVLGFDIIAPEGYGEVVGASQREEDIQKIEDNLKKQGENPREYDFYLDTRRYGSVPHGGFGMGVERIVSWICGLDNIKDAIAFPRTMLRYKP